MASGQSRSAGIIVKNSQRRQPCRELCSIGTALSLIARRFYESGRETGPAAALPRPPSTRGAGRGQPEHAWSSSWSPPTWAWYSSNSGRRLSSGVSLPSLKNPRTAKFLPRRTSWPVSQTIQICTKRYQPASSGMRVEARISATFSTICCRVLPIAGFKAAFAGCG
jgi:hypothetical protein